MSAIPSEREDESPRRPSTMGYSSLNSDAEIKFYGYPDPSRSYGKHSNFAIEARLRLAKEKGVTRGVALARGTDPRSFARPPIRITPVFAFTGPRIEDEDEVDLYGPSMNIHRLSPYPGPSEHSRPLRLTENPAITIGIDKTPSDGIRKRIDRGGRGGR